MKMTLFKRMGNTWTRIQLKKSERMKYALYLDRRWRIMITEPDRENRRYLYFDRPGNLIKDFSKDMASMNDQIKSIEI